MPTTPYQNFDLQPLGGQWRAGSSKTKLKVLNPFTGDELLALNLATQEDMNEAFTAARDAQVGWAALGPSARAGVLLKAVEIFDQRRAEIMNWLIEESGSTRVKAQIEWESARAITLEAASFPSRVQGSILPIDIPDKESRVYRKALGVVGVISPWNFPLHLSQRSVAPALALGNAVVIKPASDTPVSGGLLLAHIFAEAGLPAGVLSVVVGSGAEIGDAFVDHPIPGFISFTGSTSVGLNVGRIACGGKHLKHVALELGGNCPFVVLADADVEQAVNAAVFGKFLHQGQICMAINRIIVEQPLLDAFTRRYVERVRALKYGDPRLAENVVGPIINAKQLAGLLRKIETAKGEGAELLVGGDSQGNVLPPHVFGSVTADMEIAREEIFGPIVGIQSARNEQHALQLANQSDYGLSSAVFTGCLERGVRFAQGIQAGMSHINDMPVNDAPNAAFGGEKGSGLGRFNGEWAIQEFTRDHWITVQHEPRCYPF